ncbi:MAG TPA: hypothetical protein PK546_05385, partial [Chitinophagales bacterium]|nr:hypothetical protein [Chitinophagales bacterium]
IVGHNSGNNVAKNEMTIIGTGADVADSNLINATAIGAKAEVNSSNAMVLGSINGINGATATVRVGIGTQRPLSRLDDSGSLGLGIRTINANTSLTIDDHTVIIVNTVGASAITITLPAANTCARREYVVVNQNVTTSKSFSVNYLDFTGTAVNTIPGTGSITIQSNGTNWYRIR